MDEKEKIEEIMQELDLNSAQFASEIGIQGSTLSHILNGRNKPSLDVLKKILNRFQTINPEWLIMGNGPMYRQEKHSQAPTLFDNIDENNIESDIYTQKNAQKTDTANERIQKEIQLPNIPSNSVEEIKTDFVSSTLTQQNSKTVIKIILYYTDNTFQEFHP